MTVKNRFHHTDYDQDLAKFEEFFTTFKDENGDLIYQATLDDIRVRKSTFLNINLDDITSYDKELSTFILENTPRYIQLLYAAADKLVGEINFDYSSQFGALVATRNAAWAESRDPTDNSKPPFPAELHRPYFLCLCLGSKTQVTNLRLIRADSIGKLIRFRGLVTRVTPVKPLIRVASYTCSQCSEETFQVVNSPTFMQLTMCQSPQCKASAKPGVLTLQTRSSKFQKFQRIRIQELTREVPAGHIPRSISAYAKENLTQLCNSGDEVEIDGIFLPTPVRGHKLSLINDTFIDIQSIKVVPKYIIGDTEKDVEGCSYEKLAKSIAPEIYGHLDVKKSLLLSLVGGVTKCFEDGIRLRGDINICLMGDPGVAKSQLLKWVSRISQRSIYTTGRGSSGVGLTAAVMKDPVTGEVVLEGGALVLSDMGVCCIDEFDKMDDGDRTAIYEVMEQQTVSIAKAGISTTLNARTAILAAANPVHSRYNPKKSLIENINLPAALLSRFDLIFLMLDKPSLDSDLELAKHIAYVHTNRSAPFQDDIVPLNQLKRYLENVKSFEPQIPDELKKYISASFVQMRTETADSPVTARSLMAILRLSMALAKIRLSEEVHQADVNEALRLVRASKESIEVDHSTFRKADPQSEIFEKISDVWKGHASVSINDVKKVILQSGHTLEKLQETLDEYQRLGVWQLNPAGTKLTFTQ